MVGIKELNQFVSVPVCTHGDCPQPFGPVLKARGLPVLPEFEPEDSYWLEGVMGISVPNLARLMLKKLLTLRTFMSCVNSLWLSSR